MAGIKLGAENLAILNGKYFPRLLSPWLEGLCQVPQCQKGSGYSPSGLTCMTSTHSHHPLTHVKHFKVIAYILGGVFVHLASVNFNVSNLQ